MWIISLSPNNQLPADERLFGDLLIFAGAFVYAIYGVMMRRHFLEGESSLTALGVVSWVSFLGWLILIPVSFLEQPWDYHWDLNAALLILYLGVFSTVLAYVFFAWGVMSIGASRSAIFINLVPAFGIFFSWMMLNERLGFGQVVAFLLISAGVFMVNRRQGSAEEE